jgi:hypothetical protein
MTLHLLTPRFALVTFTFTFVLQQHVYQVPK